MVTKDILWKGIIEDLFEDFLWYFFPTLSLDIDFSRPFEFLDKELDALFPEAEVGSKRADKLVKVFTKDGNARFILLHIEVQGYEDKIFGKRMFTYFYRILERWQTKVTALAIFTDDLPYYLPTEYVYDFAGTYFVYKFNTFKLLQKTKQELEKANNPFSIVMKVAKKAIEKGQLADEKQMIWKVALTKELYQAGYSREKVQHIFDFLRSYVRFADEKNVPLFDKKIEPITKPTKPMGIREAIETALLEQGKAEGEAKGEAKGIKQTVFGIFAEGLSLEAIVRITKLPLDTIQAWQQEWKAQQA
jgi:hypothetical protein